MSKQNTKNSLQKMYKYERYGHFINKNNWKGVAGLKRRYRLQHLTDPGKAEDILSAACQVKGIKEIAISADLREMDVEADLEELPMAMEKIVNICRSVADECEIQYLFS